VSHGEAGLAATMRVMSLSIMALPPQADSISTADAAKTNFFTAKPLYSPKTTLRI
jgi:hypothetical protein